MTLFVALIAMAIVAAIAHASITIAYAIVHAAGKRADFSICPALAIPSFFIVLAVLSTLL